MQLEPNPVFSIIDEQMDKMNMQTKERVDSTYAVSHSNSIAASQSSDAAAADPLK